MRQDKTVARIILLFSIANVVLAAPASVRPAGPGQRRDEPLLAGSVSQNDMVPVAPRLGPRSEHGTPPESEQDLELGPPNGPVHQDIVVPPLPSEVGSAHESPAGSENNRLLGSPGAPVRQGSVSYSYSPPGSDFGWSDYGLQSESGWSAHDSALHSTGFSDVGLLPNSPSSLHLDSAPDPPSGSLHKDLVPVSTGNLKAPELHDYLSVASSDPQMPERPLQWWQFGSRPSTWEAGESSNSAGDPSQTAGELSKTLGKSPQTVGESSQTVGESSHTVPEAPETWPENLPPAVETQPLHDEKTPWWHELYLYADVDQDQGSVHSTKWGSWGSEAEAKLADEAHFRRSF